MSRRINPKDDKAAQNQQTINALLRLEGNKQCADCKRNKHPRWASWNLGVFVCIRCSGIHRGMGTHISRVKSVELDAWTDEQLQSVVRWGNARANKYWEAKLSPGHVPSDAKIENFIRTKYESKRWVMDGPMPDPSALGDDDDDNVPLSVVQQKAQIDRSASQRIASTPSRQPPPPLASAKPAPQSFDLIGGDDYPNPPARPSTTDNVASLRPPPPKQPQQQQTQPSQLLGGLDFLGGATSRPATATGNSFAGISRPDLKQSILSLYASTPKTQPQPQLQPQPQTTQSGQQSLGAASGHVKSTSSFGRLDDAFSGLSFPSSSTPATTATQAAPKPSQQQSSQPKPLDFSSFSKFSAPPAKSAPAPAQISPQPPPLVGGTFFDTGPKPPPKPSASRAAPQPLRKVSNASDFGEFSSALNPTSGSSFAGSSNGLLDLSNPPSATQPAASKPAVPHTSIGSVFNLSKPKPPPSYAAMNQSSAPPSKTAFGATGMTDPWASNEWNTNEPAVATPQTGFSAASPPASSASKSSFGWGASNASTSTSKTVTPGTAAKTMGFPKESATDNGWASSFAPQPAARANDPFSGGFGAGPATSTSVPKVKADDDFGDFGGWNDAAPEAKAPSTASNVMNPATTQTPQGKPFNAPPVNDDLFSNVWG